MKTQYYSIEQIEKLNLLSKEDINLILSDERFKSCIMKNSNNILIDTSIIFCVSKGFINLKENKTEEKNINVLEENKLLKQKIEELNNKLFDYTDRFIEMANKAQNIAENVVLSSREQNIIKAIDGESPHKKNIFKRIFKKSRE